MTVAVTVLSAAMRNPHQGLRVSAATPRKGHQAPATSAERAPVLAAARLVEQARRLPRCLEATAMIYDVRCYDLRPGGLPAYRDAVREVALPVRQRYGIALAGWYYADVGTLSRVLHIWAFRDWQHLEHAKRQFRQDPQWSREYLPRVLPLIGRQHCQAMLAADFWERRPVATGKGGAGVYELRTDDLKPGGVPAYLASVREVALPVLERYGVKPAGWYYPEIGTLNRVLHLWAYRDGAHLAESRRQLRSDPRWINEHLPRVRELIVAQKSQLMHAAEFSPAPP